MSSEKPGLFKKGQSGNPGGRPKAAGEMARMIREMTHDGVDLVKYAISVLVGDSEPRSKEWACEWLADRGFGKAQQFVEVDTGPNTTRLDLSALSTEQLAAFAAALAAMKGRDG